MEIQDGETLQVVHFAEAGTEVLKADYVGLVHYRRYFTRKEVRNIEKKKEQILNTAEWQNLLAKCPVVVADKRKYYIETNRSHYNHAHPSSGLDVTEEIIRGRSI